VINRIALTFFSRRLDAVFGQYHEIGAHGIKSLKDVGDLLAVSGMGEISPHYVGIAVDGAGDYPVCPVDLFRSGRIGNVKRAVHVILESGGSGRAEKKDAEQGAQQSVFHFPSVSLSSHLLMADLDSKASGGTSMPLLSAIFRAKAICFSVGLICF